MCCLLCNLGLIHVSPLISVQSSSLQNNEERPNPHDNLPGRQIVPSSSLRFVAPNNFSLEELQPAGLSCVRTPQTGRQEAATGCGWCAGPDPAHCVTAWSQSRRCPGATGRATRTPWASQCSWPDDCWAPRPESWAQTRWREWGEARLRGGQLAPQPVWTTWSHRPHHAGNAAAGT